MSSFLVLLLLFGGPEISKPVPVLPVGSSAQGNAMVWRSEEMAVHMEPVNSEAFFKWLLEHGVDQSLFANKKLNEFLSSFAVFRVSLYNTGTESLIFNPEQMQFRNKVGPVGYLVNFGDVLRTQHGHSDPRLEKLAKVFEQESLELRPGLKVGRIVAFKPMGRKFPRKVQLVINQIYYGITSTRLECGYQVRYP